MLFTLRVLNEDASLNSFAISKAYKFVSGSDITPTLQLWQTDKQIRFMPALTDVITCDFLKSDGTYLSKTASWPFADDRSIIRFSLSDAETPLVVSQNLIVKIQSGTNTYFAILQSGFQRVIPTQQGC